MDILNKIRNSEKTLLAVLIDPDCIDDEKLSKIIDYGQQDKFDVIFIGGSLVFNSVDEIITKIKQKTSQPVVLFPGNPSQFTEKADALLFLSLLSGRNPEYLIGHHVTIAKRIKYSGIETIPTAYILVSSGQSASSTEYLTNTKPIPSEKPEIAASTAIAGELLGFKTIYVEGGSGVKNFQLSNTIKAVKAEVNIPIIAGGGIKDENDLLAAREAGADVIVVGTAFEKNPDLIPVFNEILSNK